MPEPAHDLEIRLHGRGGQGGVTCAKILAAVYADLGKSVQSFGDYAGERSGAPVRAYTRVSDRPVTNRNKVYHPDHLLVLDPSLLGEDIVSGLAPGGTLILNSPEPLSAFADRFLGYRLAVIDATAIARRHGIGTRSVVIVNTTIAGAYVRAVDLPLEALEDAYRHLGFFRDYGAAREAFSATQIRPAQQATKKAIQPDSAVGASAPVLALLDHHDSPPTGLKTGSWRTQTPRYQKHLAPCTAWCPAGNDVIGFVQALARTGESDAATILGRSTPLAAVCGRVCPAPCMEGCNRRELDGAVNIRGLERWIADHHPVGRTHPQPVLAKNARRFAVVGGGPAGLSAAYTLALAGQRVVLFEGETQLGGVLRTGIPTYRLPRDVLDREIDDILALGVEARTGQFFDRDGLGKLSLEYDALILATGLQRLRGIDDQPTPAGVEQGIRFLHRVNIGGGVQLGGQVVVLGGGNTAMDCARSAIRAGAEKVTVVYRRSKCEMPAIAEEVEHAEHEGVSFLFLRAPLSFESEGKLRGVVLAEVELGPPDDSGRRSPITTDRASILPCDHLLLALGQSADLSKLPMGWELSNGQILRDGSPLPVFAAGDLATGEGTVTHAIGDGRRAATRAMRALNLEAEIFQRPDRDAAVPATDIRFDHFQRSSPALDRLTPAAMRKRGYAEVSFGLENALEAHRCFSCGDCTQCDTCLVYCPEGIIRRKDAGYAVDYTFCKGCGICAKECPRKAMEMSS